MVRSNSRTSPVHLNQLIAKTFQEAVVIQLDPEVLAAGEHLGGLRFSLQQSLTIQSRGVIDYGEITHLKSSPFDIGKCGVPLSNILDSSVELLIGDFTRRNFHSDAFVVRKLELG